jgi:two-component system phosphate regulon response regulator PhoB
MASRSQPAVLIIEDDPFLQRAYRAKFSKEGFRVVLAGDGERGLALARETKPAVIILDLMLPKLSGLEVLKSLRAEAGTAAIPVVVLSNLGQEADQKAARSLGAVDYLVKANTRLEEVVKRVRAHLP